MKKLSPEALAALAAADFDTANPDIVRFPKQMERDVYIEVNKALEALGGKWNRAKHGHVFSGIPKTARHLIEELLATAGYVDKKKELGFFQTPKQIADLLVKLADIKACMHVLEPSAGRGQLAKAVVNGWTSHNAPVLTLVEVDDENVKVLAHYFNSHTTSIIYGDFLEIGTKHPAPSFWAFDHIVMNPPFAKHADVEHVMHAFKFLKPGGRLVSVMSAHVTFAGDTTCYEFRKFVTKYGAIDPEKHTHVPGTSLAVYEGAAFLDLPARSFADSGTGVNTVVVVLEKP